MINICCVCDFSVEVLKVTHYKLEPQGIVCGGAQLKLSNISPVYPFQSAVDEVKSVLHIQHLFQTIANALFLFLFEKLFLNCKIIFDTHPAF